jgi:hypothetical protein
MTRLKALAVTVLIACTMLLAPSARASVPYSWSCHRGSSTVHVWTPGGVGYWAARGYRCYGGYWRYV